MAINYVSIVNGKKFARPIKELSEFEMLRSKGPQLIYLKEAREGNAEAKGKLEQFNYSLASEDGEPFPLKGHNLLGNSVCMDIDFDPASPDYEKKMAEVPKKIIAMKDELGLLMLERSVNKGYHMAFLRHTDMTNEENLQWASNLLGIDYDACAKDVTRVFYATSANSEDLLYIDLRLFDTKPVGTADNHVVEAETYDSAKTINKEFYQGSTVEPEKELEKKEYPDEYDGVPIADIVEALEDFCGGVPEHGSRNNFIFSMGCYLRYICNNDPNWIAKVMPNYGEDEAKKMRTIKSACNRNQSQKIPEIVLRAIDRAREVTEGNYGSGEGNPPAMPRRLPSLIALLVSKTPRIYKPAVAHAVFPALGAHCYKVVFKYFNGELHEPTLMNVLMAGSGAGKSCISYPIDYIMKDIYELDVINLEKEQQWKDEVNSKGNNKDKPKRPEGLVIQCVEPDITNAAFVLRTKEAEEHFLYTKMNEIEQLDGLKSYSRSKTQFEIIKLSFDYNNQYGQTRVGEKSVSARVCIRFNWNASTTISKGQWYFKDALTDGTIYRINFCTIPEQPIGSPIPIYGTYDTEFESRLRPYIDRLKTARGLVECPQALRFINKLIKENQELAVMMQSRTFEEFCLRANVIAYIKAMVLYIAEGQWSKAIEDFIRWSLRYDLWCKMHFFGDAVEDAKNAFNSIKHHGPKNMLDDLSDTFTTEELIAVRRKNNLGSKGTKVMLGSWKHRGFIFESENNPDGVKHLDPNFIWEKNKKYRSKQK